MLSPEKLFSNFFNDETVIPSRLYNFATDTINNFTVNNGGGDFTTLISLLTPLAANFGQEIGEVDTSLNIQKGATLTADEVISQFAETMSSEEPFIARAVGGKGTPAYIEFYPGGISEYSRPNKTAMPLLTERVHTAAAAHAAELGAPLTATLQAFVTSWEAARNNQQQQMGAVGTNRNERSANRFALELGLLTAVHTIGGLFPGDVPKCMSFFKFNLLFAQTKHKHKNFSGPISAGSTIEVLNRQFTDTATIIIRNTDDNSTLFAWLSATPDGTMPSEALEILPGKAHEIKPSQLGLLANTFLLLHNSSSVNEGSWEVETVG